MKSQVSVAVLLASSLPTALGWGSLGHETVGYIASNFVTAATKSHFQSILGDTSADYLASVATYADSFRYTTAGKFSAPFHYIDANDSPPSSCGVDLERDCGTGGCVVSAIKNYTSRVQSTTLSSANVAQAAKMIVHFIGDIHQPLHDEALDVGGNSITVTFDGKSTNLHSVWDSSIAEKLIGGYALSDAKSWATTLTTAIKSGDYKSDAAGWLKGIELKDPEGSSMVWAKDTNAFVCSSVLKGGIPSSSTDLSGAYYTAAVPVVKEQIAKAGYRLAAWLNLIATGSTGL